MERAVTRRLGARDDATHRAAGDDGEGVSTGPPAAGLDRGAVPQSARRAVPLPEPGVGARAAGPVTVAAGVPRSPRLAAADIALAVVEHAVRGERRRIELRVVKTQGEELPRLQVL